MMNHYRRGDEEEYEQEYYDEYEEEGSEEEQEEEEEPPSKEQQDFLKLREELKDRFRQKLKNQTAAGLKSQDKKRTTTNDRFGSFFGPSQPVIASRVLDESRSIRETQHIISRTPKSSSNNAKDRGHTSSDKKTVVHKQQSRVVNEVKKKAQMLKDMRDYSFLLSDDAEVPDANEEQKQPARKPSIPNSDGRITQAQIRCKQQTSKPARPITQAQISSKQQMSKPARPISNGHALKNPASRNPQSQTRMGPVKGATLSKPKPVINHRKVDEPRNGSGRPLVHNKAIPSKLPSQSMGNNRPHANSSKDPYMKNKPSSVASHSSAQKNRYPEQQKRPSHSVTNRPSVSSKPQLPRKVPPQDRREERVIKKQPMKRRLDEYDDDDEGQNAINMIRQMFKYNPSKYAGADDDVSDMEADFHQIEKEERRSLKIARQEDEEQLRLLEEEERRERMRKKQKIKRG